MAKKDLNEAAKRATSAFFGGDRDAAVDEPAERTTAETDAEPAETVTAEPDVQLDKKKEEKKKKTSFSFRGTPEDVRRWQTYGSAVKMVHSSRDRFCTDDLWREAIEEYIERHPLKGLSREIYEKKMKE